MLDVEVIGDRRYGVVEPGSRPFKLIKAVNSALVMKRLAAESGEKPKLSVEDLRNAARMAGVACSEHDLKVLEAYRLIESNYEYGTYDFETGKSVGAGLFFSNTDLGVETLKQLKAGAEEILIPL